MNWSVLLENLPYLLWGAYPDGPLGGAALTLILSMGSALASAVLGAALGMALAMSQGPARHVLTLVLGFFRAIPVLMLIFWTYFLLPIAFGIDVPGVLSVMCALSLIGAAYLAHSVAAGINGIGDGQWQAGLSLGLPRLAVLRHIVLPQALRMMAPSFINQWVTLIKDSSLAYIVGVGELSFMASQVNSRLMIYPAEIFMFVGAIYFVLCSALEQFAGWVARHYRPESIAYRRLRRLQRADRAGRASLHADEGAGPSASPASRAFAPPSYSSPVVLVPLVALHADNPGPPGPAGRFGSGKTHN